MIWVHHVPVDVSVNHDSSSDCTGLQKDIPLFDINDRKGKDNEGSVAICHVEGVLVLPALPYPRYSLYVKVPFVPDVQRVLTGL